MTTLSFERKRIPEFPAQHEFDTVIVSNRDPSNETPPDPVKKLVKLIEAGGWQTNIGYSRAYRRGQRTGTYRIAEFFGVFAWSGQSPFRIVAIYWRFIDKTQMFEWYRDTMQLEQSEESCGTPIAWTWQDARIIEGFKRHRMKVTDIKEFVSVRGSVLPGWFAGIARRFQEQAAKALCGDTEEHESHPWDTVTGIMKLCSGKATKPKETEGD